MKLWHVLDADEICGTRRGVILRRFDGKIESIALVLSVRGLAPRLHLEDFANTVVYAPSEAYCVVYSDHHYGYWTRPRIHRGIGADPTVKRGEPRKIRFYRCAP